VTPQIAIHDPIFRAYLAIVLAILALAGISLAVAQRIFGKDVSKIWLTWRSWLVMAPLVAVAVFLGRAGVIVGTMLLSIFGFKELARATGLYRDWWMTGVVYLLIVGVAGLCLMPDPNLHVPGWFGAFMAAPIFGICVMLLVPILRNRTEGQLQAVAISILGFIYIGWMLAHLGFLANSSNPYGYVLFVIFAAEINDVAAFTFGKLFGRHKLRSNISPNKTWEGALGALAVSMVLPWVMRFSIPHFGALQLILTGLIVGVGGQLGDLSISFMKRDIGIKDMGASIPGHGGILDRIDSLIFIAPLFTHMVNYFYGVRP
jgi:phosphatidate cytidylyltransferase